MATYGYCPSCGEELVEDNWGDAIGCPNCDAEDIIKSEWGYCPDCGEELVEDNYKEEVGCPNCDD